MTSILRAMLRSGRGAYTLIPFWLADGDLNMVAKRELLEHLRPFPHFERRSYPAANSSRVHDYVDAQVLLRARDHTSQIVSLIEKEPRKDELLALLADDFTSLLKETLDWFAAMGHASESDDPSWIEQPSVSAHAQNRHFREWTYLIDLVRDSFLSLAKIDSASAEALLKRWVSIKYPLFRRLVIHALTEWTSP